MIPPEPAEDVKPPPSKPPRPPRHAASFTERSVTLPIIDLTEPFEPGETPIPPDEELTCFACGLPRVELAIVTRADGCTVFHGLHRRCLAQLHTLHPAAPRAS